MQTRWVLGTVTVVACLLSAAVGAGAVAASADAGSRAPASVTTPERLDSVASESRVSESGSVWTPQHGRSLDGRNQVGQTRGIVAPSVFRTTLERVIDSRIVVADVFDGGMVGTASQRPELRRGPGVSFAGDQSASHGDDENDDAGSTATLTTGTREAAVDSGLGTVPMIAGTVLVLGAIGGLAWYRGALPGRRSDGGTGAGTADPTSTDGSTLSATASAETRPDEPVAPTKEPLSDEDRVLSLLEDNEGRMRQVAIVEETEWSKSKVSMLLSDMEDDGAISKLRVGRENIISLAGEEPEATESPFDEE
jgi:hypothetical protein